MATTIQIKRSTGVAAPAASDLVEGELAYAEDRTNSGAGAKLYISSIDSGGNEVIQELGGKYYTDLIDNATDANTASTIVKRDGSGAAIPVLTIDAQGRITAASTASTSSTLTIGADSGSDDTVTVGTDTLNFVGTANEIETTVSNNQIQVGLPNNVTIGGNATISGNLTVSGTTTTVDSTTLSVSDPLIILASGNGASDAVDIGLYGLYDTSGSQDLYGGLFRDANNSGKWKLFKDLQEAPTTTVNVSGTGYTVATLVAHLEDDAVAITGGSITGITDLLVADGGTGVSTFTSNGIVYGNGAGALQATAAGTDGYFLYSNSGTPDWTNVVDGGTYS